jgi:hypothetical protein
VGVHYTHPLMNTRTPNTSRWRYVLALFTLGTVATLAAGQATQKTREVPIDGDRLGGFVLPIEPIATDLVMTCDHAWQWSVDDTQRLFLQGNVAIDLGSYAFASSYAVIWINRLPSSMGLVNQIAIWFPNVSEPTRRAGLGASGRDVLLTASTLGAVRLRPVLFDTTAPERLATVRDGEDRLARYLRRLVRPPFPPLASRPFTHTPPPPVTPALEPGGTLATAVVAEPTDSTATVTLPSQTSSSLPIFLPEGMLSFSADELIIDETIDAMTVLGSVLIHYDSRGARDSFETLSLAAKRGVVFLEPGTVSAMRDGSGQLQANAVRGIFLEGRVRVTDGNYTLRGESVYYDLRLNKALALDAILRTYDRTFRSRPLHARAKEMRQLSANEWTAEKATISTSEFFEPHISVGLDRVVIAERPDESGEMAPWTRGENLTIRANGVPFFFWPGFEGSSESSPLKGLNAGWDRYRGGEIETTWDLYGLLALAPPRGVDATLIVDAFTERGPGLGVELSLSGLGNTSGSGELRMYGLYDFGGTDRTAGGVSVEVEDAMRGEVLGEYRANLSVDLMLETQLAYISDETWVSAWRDDQFRRRREYETSVFLDWSPDNTSLSVLAKTELNDFLSNSWLLASRPYFVEKLPELAYARVGDDLWNVASITSETSLSRMALRVTSGSPASLGVRRQTFAAMSNAVEVEDLYANVGYNDNQVLRFHTRHELAFPILGDGWNVTPYAFTRFTGYLHGDFESYRTQQGIDPDLSNNRAMAGGGIRSSARFVRVHNDIQSNLFDLHRVRHIVEPNATLFYGWDSHPNGAFPIYDQGIEGATGGTAAQLGLTQTLQTQRGGAGNWRSVDVLKVDVGVVLSDATDAFQRTDALNPTLGPGAYDAWAWVQSPYPQFYRYRPELSQWGTHGYTSVSWALSNTFTIASTGLWSWDDRTVIDMTSGSPVERTISGLLRGSIAVEMTHTPDASTYLEYRYLGASDDEILQGGLLYRVGRRYRLSLSPQWDLRRDEFRAFNSSIRRTFPDFDLSLRLGYDLIRDETRIGLRLSIPANAKAGIRTY